MPGERGPPLAPITPSVASVTFTSSDSNHSSRKSAALCVKILTSADDVLRAQSAQLPGELQVVDEIRRRWRKLRRRGEQQIFHHLRQALQLIFVRRVDLGVALGELGDFRQRFAAVLPHEEMAAVGKGGEERRILGVHLVAEARQLQFADDALLQQAGEVRGGGDAVARPDLFGDRASAHQFAPLQHQDLAPGARQVRGGDQSVVAAADDDRHRISSCLRRFLNATTASGGSVTAMQYGRLCLATGRDETMPPLPMLLPPNSSESVLRISW